MKGLVYFSVVEEWYYGGRIDQGWGWEKDIRKDLGGEFKGCSNGRRGEKNVYTTVSSNRW